METRSKCCILLAVVVFLILVIGNIVFISLYVGKEVGPPTCQTTQDIWTYNHTDHGSVVADLNESEYESVKLYMLERSGLDISNADSSNPNVNFIFVIDLALPKKADVLRFWDDIDNAPKPARQASVVVFHGVHGYIKEYVVGPLGSTVEAMGHRDVTMEKYGQPELAVTKRPLNGGEFSAMLTFLFIEVFMKMPKIMKESFGQQPLLPFEGMPRGLKPGDRETWITLYRFMRGLYLHPIGLEVLLSHPNTNASQWYLKKLWYNGQYFDTTEALKEAYDNGKVNKIVYKEASDYASLKPRSRPKGLSPLQTYLQGKRFSVKNNQVMYMDWSFAFGLSVSTGMRAFDIRFKGERIAYEISVQETVAVYGSASPTLMLTKFIENGIGIGRFALELVRGVDCPYDATYIDTYRSLDTSTAQRFRDSICVFEHDIGRPLRRHLTDFFVRDYGGLANSALIIRSITTIGNYDYVWDFIFYQNGAVEARVHATGYISSSFFVNEDSLRYGHQVAENTLGNIHTHFINFKVDLDILGVKNVFQTKDMAYEEVSVPWMPERKAKIPRLVENQLKTEQEAALRHDQPIPRYLHVASNRTNRWGHPRSYRLQVISSAPDHLPESEPEERAMSWARYKLAITKHKDSEQHSSSLFNQNDIFPPAVDFSKFIADNESIENEDLVAWVTTGFLHIPHAEDVPNTVTVGNGGGVLLRPHNYFDEDPSINSPDGVFFEPGSEHSCEYNKMACLKDDVCAASLGPFSYSGFGG
ncbi:membrane primary amine oxidase-like [Engraulis encrasicolus]|uniref:membrane primary amine oxidase-like n=1 Tax=Engraulis encrasicolus TaxID=184585 RepID=UPI002FCF4B94